MAGTPVKCSPDQTPAEDVVHTITARAGIQKTLRPLRILLAEDNEINQRIAIEFLELRGHQVHLAQNGVEVLAALAVKDFDVILMDVMMPEMDGFHATAAIRERAEETRGHIHIIAITGYAMKGDKQRCLDAGMDAYLAKPLRSKALFEAIENIKT